MGIGASVRKEKNACGGSRARCITESALFAAVICVLSPLSIPIGPVPLSLGLLGVLLAAVVLGSVRGFFAVLCFVIAGICGFPVFSGGAGGAAVLLGPTGGYIWGYAPAALVAGLSAVCPARGMLRRNIVSVALCAAGTAVCYLCGSVQYSLIAGISPLAAALVCVFPFIPADICKCILAGVFGTQIRSAIKRA